MAGGEHMGEGHSQGKTAPKWTGVRPMLPDGWPSHWSRPDSAVESSYR